MVDIKPLNDLSSYLLRLIKGKLWLQVIIALILGSILGVALNPSSGNISVKLSEQLAVWFDLPGIVFLKIVQMVMIPLIFSSIISGIISNTSNNLKSMGLKLLLYFIVTTIVAITIGILLATWLKPGEYVQQLGGLSGGEVVDITTSSQMVNFDNIPDVIADLIPHNPLEAMLTGEMLGVVIFTIIIGIAITQLKDSTIQPIIKGVEALQKICMIVVSWAMLLVPYAVFGMMVALLSRIGFEVVIGLGYFIVVVLFGLLILLVFYLLVLFFTTGTPPFSFLKKIKDAQLLAFSTASSAAVMPISMKVADEKLNIRSSISDFVIPIGATINMDGTALFQCVTTLFIAQSYGIDLSTVNLVLITLVIVGASIGTPSIPGGGVIVLAAVLQSTGLPTEGIIIIIGIDRILGMFRAAVNVTGDLVACVVFNKWIPEKQFEVRKI